MEAAFDFDKMVKLFQDDPAAAEELRQELIGQAISQAPESFQASLRVLQVAIDKDRLVHAEPLQAASVLLAAASKQVGHMTESFAELAVAVNRHLEETRVQVQADSAK